jgi:hypothetical protein
MLSTIAYDSILHSVEQLVLLFVEAAETRLSVLHLHSRAQDSPFLFDDVIIAVLGDFFCGDSLASENFSAQIKQDIGSPSSSRANAARATALPYEPPRHRQFASRSRRPHCSKEDK